MTKKATTKKPVAAKMGRPSKYTPELAEKICELIASGVSERKIAEMPDMPSVPTMVAWKDAYPDFLKRSARAREESGAFYDDKATEIADKLVEVAMDGIASGEGVPPGVCEPLKAAMQRYAKMAGDRNDKLFGDRKKVAVTGADGGAIEVRQVESMSNAELMAIAMMKTDGE